MEDWKEEMRRNRDENEALFVVCGCGATPAWMLHCLVSNVQTRRYHIVAMQPPEQTLKVAIAP